MIKGIEIQISSSGVKYKLSSGDVDSSDAVESENDSVYEETIRLAKKLLICNTFLNVLTIVSVFLWPLNPPTIILTIWFLIAKIYFRTQKIELRYFYHDDCQEVIKSRLDLTTNIISSKKIWSVSRRGKGGAGDTMNGAYGAVGRKSCSAAMKVPFPFKCSAKIPVFKSGKERLVFLPDKLLVVRKLKIFSYEYSDVTVSVSKIWHTETERLPRDASVGYYAYQYVDILGRPDPRFRNNPSFPVCLYGIISLRHLPELDCSIIFSNASIIDSSVKFAANCEVNKPIELKKPVNTASRTAVSSSTVKYADISLPGKKEKTQPIPQRTENFAYIKQTTGFSNTQQPLHQSANFVVTDVYNNTPRNNEEENISVTIRTDLYTSRQKFLDDMRMYAGKTVDYAAFVPFVPFSHYWSTYDSMDKQQQDWYFYWRTQVRNGNYIDTDLSYIYIHIYELLNGCGWETAPSGYSQLTKLWLSYRKVFPSLDNHLIGWIFDFAQLHNLIFDLPDIPDIKLKNHVTIVDYLIERHADDRPLKLPFSLIDDLCKYSIVGSKFYIADHQKLMQEAVPRVVSLADAVLIKKNNCGILATYGPKKAVDRSFFLYQGAPTNDVNEKITIAVKSYSMSTASNYINNLVKYAENVLRELYGHRGRLRDVTLDDEMAYRVKTFLQKEYSPQKDLQKPAKNKTDYKPDFDRIEELKKDFEWVREAMTVSDVEPQKELLTDLQEVSAIIADASGDARALLDKLQQNGWECEFNVEMSRAEDEINRLANKYLACNLFVREQNRLVVEDDYRDELDHIYAHGFASTASSQDTEDSENDYFDSSTLSNELKQLVGSLLPHQCEALRAILLNKDCLPEIERIADEAFTLPDALIDEINEFANSFLNDILVEETEDGLQILEQYQSELAQALKQEE